MANHFAHQFSKIMPATALTPSATDGLRGEVVSAILARIQLSAALLFGFSPYGRNRDETFRRLLLEKPHGDWPRDLMGDDPRPDVAAKFRVVFASVCDEWAARQNLDRARVRLRIHPSAVGETHVDVLYEPAHPSGRVFLLYTLGARAEHFWFEDLDALSEALWHLYQTLDAERQWAHRALALSSAPRPVAWLRRWGSALHDAYRSLTRTRPSSR